MSADRACPAAIRASTKRLPCAPVLPARPKADFLFSYEERSQLQSFARSRSLPAALGARARIVLSSADGEPNNTIAERLQPTKATVGKSRTRFIERRIPGCR